MQIKYYKNIQDGLVYSVIFLDSIDKTILNEFCGNKWGFLDTLGGYSNVLSIPKGLYGQTIGVFNDDHKEWNMAEVGFAVITKNPKTLNLDVLGHNPFNQLYEKIP